MKSSILFNRRFPLIIVNRIGFFFFLSGFFAFFFYMLGTFQGFMDDTQFILLELMAIFGFLLILFSLIGIIFELVFLAADRKFRHLRGFFLHIFLGGCGGILALAASFLIVICGGTMTP